MPEERRMVRLTDFLTDKEIELARKLKTVNKIKAQIIDPNLTRINESLNQANDSRYLAYAVSYVVCRFAD